VGSTLPRQGFAGGVGAPQPQQQQQFSPLAVTGRGINAAVRNSGLSREQQARVMQALRAGGGNLNNVRRGTTIDINSILGGGGQAQGQAQGNPLFASGGLFQRRAPRAAPATRTTLRGAGAQTQLKPGQFTNRRQG
jgi:hypothetical protein